MATAYLTHPVSAERKAEFRGKGFTIVDARFAPEQLDEGDHKDKPVKPKKADK